MIQNILRNVNDWSLNISQIKGCVDSSVVEHRLCIPWDLRSNPGLPGVEADVHLLDHILWGEVGDSCNSMPLEHDLLVTG